MNVPTVKEYACPTVSDEYAGPSITYSCEPTELPGIPDSRVFADDEDRDDGHREPSLRHELTHTDDGVEGDFVGEGEVLDGVAVFWLLRFSPSTTIAGRLVIRCRCVCERIHGWFKNTMIKDECCLDRTVRLRPTTGTLCVAASHPMYEGCDVA
jgi:hypothetical protein